MTYAKELYHWRKDNGICVRCGKQKAVNGVMCLDCKEDDAIRQMIRINEMDEDQKALKREKNKIFLRKLRQKRKEEGLCIQCGKPVYNNFSRCYECYIKSKRYKRKSRKGK